MILIIPSLIIQCVAIYVFYERHWASVSRHMRLALAGEIAMLVSHLEEADPQHHAKIIAQAQTHLYLNIYQLPKTEDIRLNQTNPLKINAFQLFLEKLSQRISYPHSIYLSKDGAEIHIDIHLPQIDFRISISQKRLQNPSTYIFVLWILGATAVMVTIAILFMRIQVRSMTRLAQAAEQFGRGQDSNLEHFKPEGAQEVRKAGEAFLEMRNRIQRQVQQRMDMLAGVSHDLKTPLTRMKLQLALMPHSESQKELENDVIEMQRMVKEYLDFAKGNEQKAVEPVNINDLFRSIIAAYRGDHHRIELNIQSGVTVVANANAMRRAFTNIIDNAMRYAKALYISSQSDHYHITLYFDDNGPGIPPSKRKEVFKPFYRLDDSRNLDKNSGTGLGLAITRDAIIQYGGDVRLDQSPYGGLRVIMELPA